MATTKKVSDIFPIGTELFFHSGNFMGHNGIVKSVDENSIDPSAIFGFIIHVKLDDGRFVKVEKSEHISKV